MPALFAQQPTMYSPDVDPSKETVEGRIGGLLQTDGQGNYTNQVVRQAVDRQDEAFNARGLRNSSLAVQGGTEAAISKAADIATPDARTYYDNRRANLDQTQSTRGNYEQAMQNIATNYQRQLDTINASNMNPQDKSVAIAQAGTVRDGELAFQNDLFNRVPGWQQDWLAPAVNMSGSNVSQVNNLDTLSNIAADPGQTQQVRDDATQRLQAIRAGTATMYGGAPLPATSFPAVINGQPIPWDSTGPLGSPALRPAYEAYRSQGGSLSPEQWYLQQQQQQQQTAHPEPIA